jgi:hypothetical protein
MPALSAAGFPYRRHNVSGQYGCVPFIVAEAKTQSEGWLYALDSFNFSSDSARAESNGTSFAEASVFGNPWTIMTTERRT